MGLLDDAIREHLELKRRRGADPDEVARAEQEALGPVRREPEAAPLQEAVQGEPLAHEHDDAHAYAAPATADHGDPAPATHAHEPAPEPAAPEEQTRILPPQEREPAPQATQPFADEPPPHVDPSPRAEPDVHEQPASESTIPPHGDLAHGEPVDPRHSDIVHQPTTEWRIEDEDEPFAPEPATADEQASDEDVLEETPDFLQETPEHDRLWFEQRPPRDFDFDD
jgi:hypothetical protein